jgi:serine/threonine protein kinase
LCLTASSLRAVVGVAVVAPKVYKGKYLTTTVAVKKLHQHNDDIAKDFLHEVPTRDGFGLDCSNSAVKAAVTDRTSSLFASRAVQVQIMKNLRHPNIVLWMGVQHDTEKGELSIVTEFVPNGNRSGYACARACVCYVACDGACGGFRLGTI